MTRTELIAWLKANIRADAYDISGSCVVEAYVLRPHGSGWEVFYSERGLKTNRHTFETESSACEFFRKTIQADPTTLAK